jgi:hypothetical protein
MVPSFISLWSIQALHEKQNIRLSHHPVAGKISQEFIFFIIYALRPEALLLNYPLLQFLNGKMLN